MKTRSGKKEIERLETVRKIHQKSFFEVGDVTTSDNRKSFRLLVPNRDYRNQIVHHAFAGDLDYVLYMEATQKEMVYAILIKVPKTLWKAMVYCFLNLIKTNIT